MGTRIVMLCCTILIPGLVLLFGAILRKKTPREINAVFGYRTRRSIQNQETWDFAQRYLAKIWMPAGAVMLAVSAAAAILFFRKDLHTFGVAVEVLTYVQLAAVLLSIPLTEHALKREFDENGKKR